MMGHTPSPLDSGRHPAPGPGLPVASARWWQCLPRGLMA